jgi:homoserine dehydrogenase
LNANAAAWIMPEPLRVGLAGLGTVGSAVAAMLLRSRALLVERTGRSIEVVAFASKDPPKSESLDLSRMREVKDPVALARDGAIDVFVELMGGEGGAAKSSVETALGIGRSVVTANKALLARHGAALARLAEKHNAALCFEAAVAGGIPIVKTLREGLGGSRIARVYGILNGTCNYILTRMHKERLSFAACLKEAQQLGYAEADPTFDIGGSDTAHKIAILTSLAFGTEVDADAVHVEGIESISLADLEAAHELGYRVKLLGVAQRTEAGIEQRVHPTMVKQGSVIGEVDGVTNAVAIDADTMELTLMGPGAGGKATASAVVADLMDLAAGRRVLSFGRPASALTKAQRAPMQRHEGGYYIRLAVIDRPGTAATIARRMAEQTISLESIMQRGRDRRPHGGEDPRSADQPAPVVLITYATSEDAVRHALAAIENDGVLMEKPQLIRIEKS